MRLQAIGRGSLIPDTPEGDAIFQQACAAFDQTSKARRNASAARRCRSSRHKMTERYWPVRR
jgi:hypothetical protein